MTSSLHKPGHHTEQGNFVIPAQSSGTGPFEIVVDPRARDDWQYTGLHVLNLAPGSEATFDTGCLETMLVPLNGSCEASVAGQNYSLRGRLNVFAGSTDVLYAGTGCKIRLRSSHGGRFAFASAMVKQGAPEHPVTLIRAEDIPVEVRGAGNMTRQVRNFGTVGGFDDCDSLIACEVITPGGNWSSYPAHKHDETTETESELEEIYYYEIAPAPSGTPGFGFHQTTSAHSDRDLELLTEVRTGDVVLVPHGWHGPCAAAPGHDMYYLNVMAGPDDERAWNITDHPDQTWVRGTWDELAPDPRLCPERTENTDRM
ncbi:5-deoxy-glucuronate isomerase [Devriesea agamarum]|uniref:5-deoxy-glucuronate isomerase n=1 Tax=Devriesea agamarum TaxID=472569 RepID=UPI00071D4ECC|nr:5-deoxy-glucuronate isomerase [Devriesea agamarum]